MKGELKMKKGFAYNKFLEHYENCHKDLHIVFNDRTTMQKVFEIAYNFGFSFPNNKKMTAYEAWDYFYKYCNKNAKPIVHFFFNNITKKNEICLTYNAVEKTYPQYKNFVAYYVY